jgi:hypothetical protein
MASNRHLSSSAVLVVVVFLLATLPGLFLLQAMVRKARHDQRSLVAKLVVRLNDRTPHHLDVELRPAIEPVDERCHLLGVGKLMGGSFPWKEAPIEGKLELHLDSDALAARRVPFELATTDGTLRASYQERYLGSGEEPGSAVPCIGKLAMDRLDLGTAGLASWSDLEELRGLLELQCHGNGRDGKPVTEDDLHFAILGTLDLIYGEPR